MKKTLVVVVMVLVGLPCCLPQMMLPVPAALKEDQTSYNKQRVLERCPLEGACSDKYDGFCFNVLSDEPKCDEVVNDGLCSSNDQSSCRCCVRCSGRSCVDQGKSACRKECEENEFSVSQCNPYCQCCQPCKPTKCSGRCVSHPDLCGEAKEYIEGVCTGSLGSRCTCCVTCEPDLGCKIAGGQCVSADEECPCGFWPNPYFGCNNGSKNCKCCTPCPPSRTCSEGVEIGRCVPHEHYCNGYDEYISDEVCCGGRCSCCKTCQPDRTCAAEHGNCYKKEIGCGPGMVQSRKGNCSSGNCVCCIPEPCPSSCNCTEGPNRGRCVAEPFSVSYNEYRSEERCIGRKCSCYKTCTPDHLCSAVNGTCFTTRTGCGLELVPSNMGTCNSENCLCCVEKPCWPSSDCSSEGDPGRCEIDKRKCSSPGEYISEETPCKGEDCFCCKKCQLDTSCEKVRGTCFLAREGCGRGFRKSEVGRCKNPENCVCCEPDTTKE